MIAFYHYYFHHYSLQKKAVVLCTFQKLRLYDEELYSSFVRGLDAVVSSASQDNEQVWSNTRSKEDQSTV